MKGKMKIKTWLVAFPVCFAILCFMTIMLILSAEIIGKGYVEFFLPTYAGPVWPFWILWGNILGWTLFIVPMEFIILTDDVWGAREKFGEFMELGFMSIFLWWYMLYTMEETKKLLKFLKMKR